MRYLYIKGQEKVVPLRIDTLQNLQILSSITFNQWIKNNSNKLTCLRKLKLERRCEVEGVEFQTPLPSYIVLNPCTLRHQMSPAFHPLP